MILRAVHKTIRVKADYDMPSRYRLYRLLKSDLEYYSKSQGRKIGRVAYLDHLVGVVSSFLIKNNLEATDDRGNIFPYDTAIEPETIKNFLQTKTPTDTALAKTFLKTIQFVDLYCQVAHPNDAMLPRSGNFVDTLGRSTATQYRGHANPIDPAQLLLLEEKRTFLAEVRDINIISPLKIQALLISLYPSPARSFSIVQIFAISRWRGLLEDIFRDSKLEWLQEHYGGVGVLTRDGLSCHVTSRTLHIPLYGLFRLNIDLGGLNPNEFNIRFFDYSEEVRNFGETKAKLFSDDRINSVIDNIGWFL